MQKQFELYLNDILDSIEKIQKYVGKLDYNSFSKDEMMIDAVVRNLEIIGEAVKKVPQDIRKKHSEIEWKKIAGLRDILIHEYSGINLKIVWDIIENKLPELKHSVKTILKK